MPSFEADVVLRALIADEVSPPIGPAYLGPGACAEFAAQLNVPEHQLWGAICNLRSVGRVEDIRTPEAPGRVVLMPTDKGQRYFERSLRKQSYPRERCRRVHSPS